LKRVSTWEVLLGLGKRCLSQWYVSKGFDGACPIGKSCLKTMSNPTYCVLINRCVSGPGLVSAKAIPNPSELRLRGLKNVEESCRSRSCVRSLVRFHYAGDTDPRVTATSFFQCRRS
jgi:hypothetical protein